MKVKIIYCQLRKNEFNPGFFLHLCQFTEPGAANADGITGSFVKQ